MECITAPALLGISQSIVEVILADSRAFLHRHTGINSTFLVDDSAFALDVAALVTECPRPALILFGEHGVVLGLLLLLYD